MRNGNILVTGGQGQLGRCLHEAHSGFNTVVPLSKAQLDITSKDSIEEAILNYCPQAIINTAAYTAVDLAETNKQIAYNINAKGAENLAEECVKHGIKLLHISTDYVFDGKYQDAYLETDITNPSTVYGKTKLQGEQLINQADPTAIILRTSWLFSEYGDNFVKTMVKLGQTKDELSVVSDQYGGPTYARDLANACIQLLQTENARGTYHYSGEPYCNWHQFADTIFKEMKLKGLKTPKDLLTITTKDYHTPAQRPLNSRLRLDKISLLDIKKSNWRKALPKVISEITP